MSESTPPLAPDLSGVQVRYSRNGAEPRGPALPAALPLAADEDPQVLIRRLTAALEDIVAFALSSADYKERAIMMHRRAIAALSLAVPARPVHRPAATPDGHPAEEGRMSDEKQRDAAGTQANRDRSDLKGSPPRPAEESGPRGSGRSAANPPAPERDTRSKQKP